MRLAFLGQSAIPVESFRRDPIVARPAVPVPDVGRRWGRPSAFVFSQEAHEQDPGPGLTIEWPADEPPEYMRIIRADLAVEAEVVSVSDGSTTVGVDRLKRMAWSYTELRPKEFPESPQPSRTTWFEMTFALHPGPEHES